MSSNDTILTMENITKTFGPVKALTDVNLSGLSLFGVGGSVRW